MFRQSSWRTCQKTHVYPHEFKRSGFVIHDWWISIRFCCLAFQGSLLCDRPVSGNNRLVKFATQLLLIFLIVVTCKNNATYTSFIRQKLHHHRDFLCYSWRARVILSQAGRARYIVIFINPAFTKMIDGKSLRSLQYSRRDTTNFAVIFIYVKQSIQKTDK